MDHHPGRVSGGRQQRGAIARALINDPSVIMADEPTGNLDRKTGERVGELLFTLNHELGTTLILVTHDVRLAERCDRMVELDGGRIVNGAEM